MALVVEDGTGKSDAESYVSVATADTIALALNLPSWAAVATALKEGHLRRASAYVSTRWRWKGEIKTLAQALAWPRVDVEDHEGRTVSSTIVPLGVQRATVYLADQARAGTLMPAATTNAIESVGAGPAKVTFAKASGHDRSVDPEYTEAEFYVHGLHRGGGAGASGSVGFAQLMRA